MRSHRHGFVDAFSYFAPMKFGKVADPSLVDFRMPQDHPDTLDLFKGLTKARKPKVYVGLTGWGNKEWKGSIYPPKAKANEFLKHYAKSFNTVELNASHYRISPPEWIERWLTMVDKGFRFCPKVNQMISHRTRLRNSDRFTLQFLEMMQRFGANLGPAFLQLPEDFDERRLPDFLSYLHQWPKELPLSIELRSPVWFQHNETADEAYAAMRAHNIHQVITDTSGRRDVLHQRLSSAKVLIRFVGNDLHPTDYHRIDDWVSVLERWLEHGVDEIYFFVHQHDNQGIVKLSTYFIEQLNKATGLEIALPQTIGQQGSLF